MKEKITHIKKDNVGRIVEFKTDCNNVYNYEICKELIQKHKITNAKIKKTKYGLDKIVSYENEISDELFITFPEFSEETM